MKPPFHVLDNGYHDDGKRACSILVWMSGNGTDRRAGRVVGYDDDSIHGIFLDDLDTRNALQSVLG